MCKIGRITLRIKSAEQKNGLPDGAWVLDSQKKTVSYQKKTHISHGLILSTAMILASCFLMSAPAKAHQIDMEAIAQIESSNNPKAVSKDGSVGLYQITPICLKHFNQANQGKDKGFYRFGGLDENGNSNMHYDGDFTMDDMKFPAYSEHVANWYMNWLFDRCWTVKDTIIAWNWGIGNWRKWNRNGSKFSKLPKTTQNYLKKYEQITGEKL